MKIVLVQGLDGIGGEIARLIAKDSIIMYGGGRNEIRELGRTKYVEIKPIVEPNSFFTWRGLVNNEMIKKARKNEFDVVICIDWFGAHAGLSISEETGKPVIAIFTSTEDMRGNSEISGLVKSCERELYEKAWKVYATNREAAKRLGEKAVQKDLWELGEEIENIDADMGIPAN